MIPYADTNFFTRYYLEVAESALVTSLAEEAERHGAPPLPVTWLHRMEVCHALQLHVFQGPQPGHKRVTPEQAAAYVIFREELDRQMLLRRVALVTDDLEKQFEELCARHTANHGFRAYDLLPVSSALILKCDTFWSFDLKANQLAILEGLRVLGAQAN